VTVDVTSEDEVTDAISAACLAFGGVDLVVNNAGLSVSKPLLDTTVDDWDRQHSVMVKGSFLVSREAARVMIAQRMGGDIVKVRTRVGQDLLARRQIAGQDFADPRNQSPKYLIEHCAVQCTCC